jgi:hypothetical protein
MTCVTPYHKSDLSFKVKRLIFSAPFCRLSRVMVSPFQTLAVEVFGK